MQRTLSASSAGSSATGATSQSGWSGASSAQGERPQEEGATADETTELQGSLRGSLQEATFSVLYTLPKEKFSEGWRWVLITMIIDYLQLAVFFIGNNFPWKLNFTAWYWKWLSWVCFTNMFPPKTGLGNGNYTFYQAVFYTLAVILVAAFLLCVFVGHSFKTGSFPWLWPIKVLKGVVSFFFEVFYISSLGIFCVSLDCTYYRAGPKVNEKFRTVECFTMPHVATIAISCSISALAMIMAFFISIANSELNPLNPEPAGQAHHRSSVRRFALISVITLVNEIFPHYTQCQGVVCLLICSYLCYNYIRYVPFQTAWVNALQAGFFASLSWASLVILLTAFIHPRQTVPLYTTLLWAGVLPSVALAWALLYYRLRWAHRVALRYRAALATKKPVIHKFFDELEVEVVARCMRITDQWGERVPEWVDTAEAVLKAGLEQFPDSPYLHILYSSYLIEARKQSQRAAGMLELARKLDPGLGERFMLFVRDREQKQRQGAGAIDGSYDLLSYVEFQNSYRAILESHTGALKAIRNFWRQLVRRDVKFGDLTGAFVTMDAAEKRAELTYKTVLDKYPSSTKLLRAYGRFLEDVRSNPWAAQRYFSEADKLEQESRDMAQDGGQGGEGAEGEDPNGDERSLNQLVDDSSDAIVVTNDAGVIQFCNRAIADMWGYTVSELQGRNVNILMGPPASSHHNQYLQRYKKTGKCTVMNSTRLVVALHKEGHSFPVNMTLKEVKQGETKSFMGIMRPAKEDVHEACVWLGSAGQVVGCDRGFTDMFGWRHSDLVGELLSSIGADSSVATNFAVVAEKLKKWEYRESELGQTVHTFTVRVRHKFGAAVEVDGEASFSGSANMRTITIKFLLDERVESLGLVSINAGGQILYCNASFETMLGFSSRVRGVLVAKKHSLADLVRGPAAKLFPRWLVTAGRAMEANIVAPTSCRTGRTVLLTGHNNREVPVKLTIEACTVGKARVLTATVTKVPIPPADAWGGGDIKAMLDGAKRVQLLVRGDGRVLTFKADPAVLSQVFGLDPAALAKKTLSELVPDLLAPPDHQGAWPSEPQLLHRLVAHSASVAAAGGKASFRVGVLPDANVMGLRQRMALGAGGTVASRMVLHPVGETEVDVSELIDEGFVTQQDVVAEGGLQVVELWREELLEGTVEMDASLKVKTLDGEACLLLGHTRESAKNKPVLALLKPLDYRLPHNARCEDFLAIKRSQLKHTADASVSDKQNMEGLHADGSTLAVQVQGADKHGDGNRWLLRVTVQTVQPQARRPSLPDVLAKAAHGAKHAESESEQSEQAQGDADDMQIMAMSGGGATKRAASEASASEKDEGTSVGDGTSVGASEAADDSSDFRRAKRFKKLSRMLSSPQARAAINGLHRYSMCMLFLMMALHVAFFAVIYGQIQGYNGLMNNAIESGECGTMTQKLLYSSRIKMSAQDASNAYSYYSYNHTWATELAAEYTPFVLDKADQVDERIKWVFLGPSDKKQVPPTVPARKVLFMSDVLPASETLQITHPLAQSHNMSLHDLTRRFTAAARLVAVPEPTYASDIANYVEYTYMKTNQQVLSDALMDNLHMSEDRAHIGIVAQTKLMAAFMGVEAGLFVPLCCLCLWALLKLVNRNRVRTFNVFVVLPRPVVMQLASKDITLRLEDDGEEDDDADGADNDTWLRQVQQGEEGEAAAKAGGKFKFNSQRRKLTNNSAQSYVLMTPFVVWACIIALTYGLSILLLRASIKPIADLAAAERLHILTARTLYHTQKLVVSSSPSSAAEYSRDIMAAVNDMAVYKEALLYGNEELGLTGSILVGQDHEELWFGTGCMRLTNTQGCYSPSDPSGYYQETSFGLNRLMNKFMDSAVELAQEDVTAVNLGHPTWLFMSTVGAEGGDLDVTCLHNTGDYTRDGRKRMLVIGVIQICALVAMFLIMAFFWMKQLRPFMRRAKQESRRVAELLSQLPPEMAVEELVMEASNMAEASAEEKAAAERAERERSATEKAHAWREKAAAAAAAHKQRESEGAGGGGFLGLFGKKGGSRVAPEGHGLSIIVTNRTSTGLEGGAAGAAGGGGLIGAGAAGAAGDAAAGELPHQRQDRYKNFHEKMHRQRTDASDAQDDPSLWGPAAGRSPRKITFGANQFSP